MSSSLMPRAPRRTSGLENGRVEPAVRLGHAGEGVVGDLLVLQRQAERPLEEAVHVSERHAVAVGGRLELACVLELLDLEVAPCNVADGLLLLAVVLQAGEHPVGGEDRAGPGRRAPRGTSARSDGRPRRRSRPHTRARSRSGGARPRSAAPHPPARPGARRSARGRPRARECCACPRCRVTSANGSPAMAWASVSVAAPPASGKRLKMGERFARVARVSLSRSSFGPGWVRSCGRIRPAP